MTLRQPPSYIGGNQDTSVVLDRLNLQGMFYPGVSNSAHRGGVLPGPNNPCTCTVLGSTQVSLSAFRALIPGTYDPLQGSYLVTNDSGSDPVIGYAAASTTTYRRDLLIAEVLDADFGGGTGNYIWQLRVVQGNPATTASGALRPGTPPNAIPLYELYVAPNASAVATRIFQWTTMRGGIVPIFSPDEDAVAGPYVGAYRDHPTYGGQRWDGTKWRGSMGIKTPLCKLVKHSTGGTDPVQNIAANVWTPILWAGHQLDPLNGNAPFTTDMNMWSSSLPTRIVCTVPGLYLVTGTAGLANAGGSNYVGVARWGSGTNSAYSASGDTHMFRGDSQQQGAANELSVTAIMPMSIGDYIELCVYSVSGTATGPFVEQQSRFEAVMIGNV